MTNAEKKSKISVRKLIKIYLWAVSMAFKSSAAFVIINILVSVIVGIIPVVNSVLYKYYIESIEAVISGESIFSAFVWLITIQGIIYLISSAITMTRVNYEEMYRTKIERYNKKEVMKKIRDMNLAEYESEEFYNKFANMLGAGNKISYSMTGIIDFIGILIGAVGIIIIIVMYNPVLLLVIFISQIPKHITKISEIQMNWNATIRETKESRMINYLFGLLSSRNTAKEIRIFGSAGYIIDTIVEMRNSLYKKYLKRLIKYRSISLAAETVANVGIAVCYGIIIGQMSTQSIDFSAAVMLFSILTQVAGNISSIGYHFTESAAMTTNLSILYDFLNEQYNSCKNNADEAVKLSTERQDSIVFNNVSFKYPNSQRNVLNNINLVINSSEKIGIVGENGSGKTTLVKLALGLYQPTSGCIYLNGNPIDNYSYDEKRQLFSSIFQDFSVYNLTVAENVAFDETHRITEIQSVIEKSGAGEFVNKFSEGADTFLGKEYGGKELSKGQWQKIGLARAQFGNKPYIALDEPASALDARAEKELIDSCIEMSKERTAIFVTHRLSVVRQMDKIFVLKDGWLEEQGNHIELMELNGIYSELYNMQKSFYI